MELTHVAFIVGMVVGVAMIGTVCIAYVKRSTFGMGGGTLSVLGVLLIGMSCGARHGSRCLRRGA